MPELPTATIHDVPGGEFTVNLSGIQVGAARKRAEAWARFRISSNLDWEITDIEENPFSEGFVRSYLVTFSVEEKA